MDGKAGAESQEPPRLQKLSSARLSSRREHCPRRTHAAGPRGWQEVAPRSQSLPCPASGYGHPRAGPGQSTLHAGKQWHREAGAPLGSFPQRVGEKYSLFTSVIKKAEQEPEASKAICVAR